MMGWDRHVIQTGDDMDRSPKVEQHFQLVIGGTDGQWLNFHP